MTGRRSSRWKVFAAAFPVVGAVAVAVAQPQPGGLGGFFHAWYGGSKISIFPDDVADMAGWWDASDASTISLVAGTNRVSEWRDKSGLDRHFTQTTASRRPYYDVVQNGRDGIRTAGNEGMFYNAANDVWRFLHEASASVFVAFEIISPQAAGDFGPILDTARLSGTGYFMLYDNRTALSYISGDALWVNGRGSSGNNFIVITNHVMTVGTPQIFAAISSATNAVADRLFVYDQTDTRINKDNTAASSITGNHAYDLAFGQTADGAAPLKMKIFELIIYSNTVTETERTGLIDYLATKWGI